MSFQANQECQLQSICMFPVTGELPTMLQYHTKHNLLLGNLSSSVQPIQEIPFLTLWILATYIYKILAIQWVSGIFTAPHFYILPLAEFQEWIFGIPVLIKTLVLTNLE